MRRALARGGRLRVPPHQPGLQGGHRRADRGPGDNQDPGEARGGAHRDPGHPLGPRQPAGAREPLHRRGLLHRPAGGRRRVRPDHRRVLRASLPGGAGGRPPLAFRPRAQRDADQRPGPAGRRVFRLRQPGAAGNLPARTCPGRAAFALRGVFPGSPRRGKGGGTAALPRRRAAPVSKRHPEGRLKAHHAAGRPPSGGRDAAAGDHAEKPGTGGEPAGPRREGHIVVRPGPDGDGDGRPADALLGAAPAAGPGKNQRAAGLRPGVFRQSTPFGGSQRAAEGRVRPGAAAVETELPHAGAQGLPFAAKRLKEGA
ncbi:MAG: hypothetical protein BWY28_00276 [bacterium ADurb.Bin236]|nr:MAG: hypothetical protein BWY28_00276 [bacterium ADurb.Bin236]